jgi:hypothetical protein
MDLIEIIKKGNIDKFRAAIDKQDVDLYEEI